LAIAGKKGANHDKRELVTLQATTGWHFPDLSALVTHRDLLVFFVLRDIRVRYRQTLLGAGWAVLQPLLAMVMLTLVFGRLIGQQSDDVPYPLFCFAGLVLWTYFAQAVTSASASVVGHAQLVEKVYFPRLVIPVAAALAGMLDLLISFGMLIVIALLYGHVPGPAALLCIPLAALAAIFAIGIGSMLAALSVRFRDVNHVVPFFVQLWLFATPVIYPASLLPERFQSLFALNPMTGIIETFRWSLLGTSANPWPLLPVSLGSGAVLVLFGLLVFRRMERSFADVI
jgi:lipopolysaccharide transport system permease protein